MKRDILPLVKYESCDNGVNGCQKLEMPSPFLSTPDICLSHLIPHHCSEESL